MCLDLGCIAPVGECWNQEVQGLLQMSRSHARASLAPCTRAWTPYLPSIAHVGLLPYLVCIFYLSGTAKETSLSITKQQLSAWQALNAYTCWCIPIPLPFDLMHGPCTPAIVSGGKCIYSPNYPHASGIIPLTSLSSPCANTCDQLHVLYPLHFTKWHRSTHYIV